MTTTTTLTELKNRAQDQHRRLYSLNAELISRILAYATKANAWDTPFSHDRTIQETIGYLRMIHSGALTAENLKLIEAATNIAGLQELSAELEAEIDHHHSMLETFKAKFEKQDSDPS